MTNESHTARLPSLLGLIPVTTALLYIYAYAHEYGFARYFGYPIQLVPINPSLVFSLFQSTFPYMLLLSQFFIFSLAYTNPDRKRLVNIVGLGIISFLIVFLCIFVGVSPIWVTVFPVTLNIFGVLRLRSSPLNEEMDSERYITNLYGFSENPPKGSIYRHLIDRVGYDPVLLMAYLLLLAPCVFGFSGYVSAMKSDFSFTSDTDIGQGIVLRVFGESSLLAKKASSTSSCRIRFQLVETRGMVLNAIDMVTAQDIVCKTETVAKNSP